MQLNLIISQLIEKKNLFYDLLSYISLHSFDPYNFAASSTKQNRKSWNRERTFQQQERKTAQSSGIWLLDISETCEFIFLLLESVQFKELDTDRLLNLPNSSAWPTNQARQAQATRLHILLKFQCGRVIFSRFLLNLTGSGRSVVL